MLGIAALSACQPAKKSPPSGACTQYFRGYVLASDHNYAGLGAFSGSDRYMCKPTPERGVRAHLQHLRNYADPNSHWWDLGNPFEPRPKYDEAAFENFPYKGQAPRWIDLNGKWAVPGSTYGQTILRIYNEMRAEFGLPAVTDETTIMGPSELTAAQIGQRVCSVGRCATWKPEITPTQMAQVFLDEGAAVGVRGDIAFCQSILETGWFSWPSSPSAAAEASDPAIDGYFELQNVTERN